MARQRTNLLTTLALVAVLVGVPAGLLTFQAHRKGLTLLAFVKQSIGRATVKTEAGPESARERPLPNDPKAAMFHPVPAGLLGQDKPWITHLLVTDLDRDGLKDILICDAKLNEVHWIRQAPRGVFTEKTIGTTILAPAHVSVVDIDKDGDLDILVAAMGMVFPNNDKIGSVVVLENDGRQSFANRVLVKNIARVTDVDPGDLDGDGDIDLAVGQFGYDDGEVRWLENKGDWRFDSHILLSLSGTVHAPVVDTDNDGDLDIVALVTQEWEETYVFENDGRGHFTTRMVYGSANEDFGSSGIEPADLNGDGRLDIAYTNGDAFDYIPPAPRPWHGVQWLENLGGNKFAYHRIADFPGAYSPAVADIDDDGDLDIAAVSCFNDWSSSSGYSLVWYENSGQMRFVTHNVAAVPTHQLVVACADMDDDGRMDLVTCGMYAYPPYDRQGRVTIWYQEGPQAPQ